MANGQEDHSVYRSIVHRMTEDAIVDHPMAVLLFGSMVRFLKTPSPGFRPNDIDLMVVGNQPAPDIESREYGMRLEVHRLRVDEITAIAKILRYDSKPVALAKLYGRQTVKQHARDVIAACLLLGPGYRHFGIEQIEVGGLTDKRDYSEHEVLYGRHWWMRLQAYARERRGPFRRFSDMAVMNYEFDG
ncbi:MAG: hypothetical protein ACOWWM_02330 [Desulfobacterales bacterium]